MLPVGFSGLEPFASKWDQPGSNERYAVRLSSTMDEMRDFYGAFTEAAKAAKAHLDAKPFEAYTTEDKRLARLMFAAAIVGQAVEVYRQPVVPDSGATSLKVVSEVEL